jgi:Rrf2 family iron-sulfur cluster assembly transcriptional regulator
MKVTPLEEYGIRLCLQLARKGPEGAATIPELAKAEALTPAYAAKVLSLLRKGGLVTALRGSTGGYRLARKADDITVLDIMHATGGKFYTSEFCGRHSGAKNRCIHNTGCSVRSLWNGLAFFLNGLLTQYHLSDLMDPARMLEIGVRNMPKASPLSPVKGGKTS